MRQHRVELWDGYRCQLCTWRQQDMTLWDSTE